MQWLVLLMFWLLTHRKNKLLCCLLDTDPIPLVVVVVACCSVESSDPGKRHWAITIIIITSCFEKQRAMYHRMPEESNPACWVVCSASYSCLTGRHSSSMICFLFQSLHCPNFCTAAICFSCGLHSLFLECCSFRLRRNNLCHEGQTGLMCCGVLCTRYSSAHHLASRYSCLLVEEYPGVIIARYSSSTK